MKKNLLLLLLVGISIPTVFFLAKNKDFNKKELMQTHVTQQEGFTLIGIKIRTNLANESDPAKAKIGQAWERFGKENIFEKIPNKLDLHVCYGLYTDYESDASGEYSLFIGTPVSDASIVPEGMAAKKVPASKYLVFTTEPGPMPQVCIEAWQYIWQFFQEHKEYLRMFTSDFEVYDNRNTTPARGSLEIYIAIK